MDTLYTESNTTQSLVWCLIGVIVVTDLQLFSAAPKYEFVARTVSANNAQMADEEGQLSRDKRQPELPSTNLHREEPLEHKR